MIVDTSAVMAILRGEPDGPELELRLFGSSPLRISAANHFELSMVAVRDGSPEGLRRVDALLAFAGVIVEPVTAEDALLAREAFLRYGKGRHPAKLNFGDCLAYALSKRLSEPLLFKGEDFARTDVLKA